MQGRVVVNGKTVHKLPVMVDPEKDDVEVDGERIRLRDRRKAKPVYYLLHKPRGVYSTNVAQGEQLRAIDLLPPGTPRVYPVGQLDSEARGLLLLTNDGDLTNRLTHPRYGVAKTYRATVDGEIDQDAVAEISKGMWLADKQGRGFKTGQSHIRIIKRMKEKSILEITIKEGRNRQIRRMLAAVGHKVKDLTRVKIGPLTLEGLPSGAVRELSPREIKDLQRLSRGEERVVRPKGAKHAAGEGRDAKEGRGKDGDEGEE